MWCVSSENLDVIAKPVYARNLIETISVYINSLYYLVILYPLKG